MIANHKGEIPVVILVLPFLAGIVSGLNIFPDAPAALLTAAFFFTGAIFILLNLSYSRFKIYKARWLGGVFITLLLFLFGWIIVIRYNELSRDDYFSKKPSGLLLIRINNEPVLKNGLLRFTAEVEKGIGQARQTALSGSLLVTIKDSSAKSLYYGDELLIPGKVNSIEPPFVPAAFNYKKYLASQNIFYQAFLFKGQYACVAHGQGNSIITYSLRLRQHLVEKLKRNMRDTDAIAVASTLILGYKADLSNDVLQAYSKTGTVHVLSVSGAHVAIIYILLAFALSSLDKYKHGKLLKAFIIILLIWYYSLLTGFSPAVCRAAVMISMVITGKTFNRYINTLNILALSAFLLLIYNPYFINDVGFQLSYLAVAGLVTFQPVIYRWVVFKQKWADKLWALCSVSIAAQVITFPLSAYYFHQFPVYFLISNIFIVIPTTVIMYSGIVYLLLPQMPLVSKALAFVLEKTIVIMNKGLAVIEHTPYASISKMWLTIPEYALLYVVIIAAFYFVFSKRTWLLYVSLTAALLFCISINVKKSQSFGDDHIAWLNLRKHTGIIFKHGTAAVVLSDLKQADKNYQYSIQPYLDSTGITDVKTLSLTDDYRNAWFRKKYNLVQYLNKSVFIADRDLEPGNLTAKIKTDYIYFTGNQHDILQKVNAYFTCGAFIADGTNSDKTVDLVKTDAAKQKINFWSLKRNISIISVSN